MNLSRVYELRDLMDNPDVERSIFRNFDQSLRNQPEKLAAFIELEKCLDVLDAKSWNFMKDDVKPYLNIKHEDRGWQQLFDVLNHVYAYRHLIDAGCKDICFIPRSEIIGVKSPDIKAVTNKSTLLCEVKTINRSDTVLKNIRNITARHITPHLNGGFYSKLNSDIDTARRQLSSYDPTKRAMHMIYINVFFDDWVGDYAEEHMAQIGQYLEEKEQKDLCIVVQPFIFFKPAYDKKLIWCHLTTG